MLSTDGWYLAPRIFDSSAVLIFETVLEGFSLPL